MDFRLMFDGFDMVFVGFPIVLIGFTFPERPKRQGSIRPRPPPPGEGVAIALWAPGETQQARITYPFSPGETQKARITYPFSPGEAQKARFYPFTPAIFPKVPSRTSLGTLSHFPSDFLQFPEGAPCHFSKVPSTLSLFHLALPFQGMLGQEQAFR
jgi:hypothetical protein